MKELTPGAWMCFFSRVMERSVLIILSLKHQLSSSIQLVNPISDYFGVFLHSIFAPEPLLFLSSFHVHRYSVIGLWGVFPTNLSPLFSNHWCTLTSSCCASAVLLRSMWFFLVSLGDIHPHTPGSPIAQSTAVAADYLPPTGATRRGWWSSSTNTPCVFAWVVLVFLL